MNFQNRGIKMKRGPYRLHIIDPENYKTPRTTAYNHTVPQDARDNNELIARPVMVGHELLSVQHDNRDTAGWPSELSHDLHEIFQSEIGENIETNHPFPTANSANIDQEIDLDEGTDLHTVLDSVGDSVLNDDFDENNDYFQQNIVNDTNVQTQNDLGHLRNQPNLPSDVRVYTF